MISYDVIGDYMSDLDDVRKRIEKGKDHLMIIISKSFIMVWCV